MTTQGASRRRLWWRFSAVLLIVALAWSPAGRVVAADQPPPVPIGGAQTAALAPAQPAGVRPPGVSYDPIKATTVLPPGVLYDQLGPYTTTQGILSQQDTPDDVFTSQAADDFFVTTLSSTLVITAVEVVGQYFSGSGTKTVSAVNVDFYADSPGLPAYSPIYSGTAVPISPTDSSGNFYLPLSPTLELASNASYWVSVQAIQSTSWYWYWGQRTMRILDTAAWQNPSGSFLQGHVHTCQVWTSITTCYPKSAPDLLFRIDGTLTDTQATPTLLSLDPDQAFNSAFTLNANGANFASGAVLNWTTVTTPTKHFPTTVSSSALLSASISAADVSSYGTVTVTVTDFGTGCPCTSNALKFLVPHLLFLPVVRR